MKRIITWLLSRKRWLIALCGISLTAFVVWLYTFRTAAIIILVVIWFIHVILGIGAGWAAVRLWYFRHNPLMKWVGVYITAFIVDVLSAIVLLFVAKGVTFTWKFSTVMFVSALICNVLRAPLIIYLIRGPSELPASAEPVVNQIDEFRKVVREEIAAASGTTTVTVKGPSAPASERSEPAPKE